MKRGKFGQLHLGSKGTGPAECPHRGNMFKQRCAITRNHAFHVDYALGYAFIESKMLNLSGPPISHFELLITSFHGLWSPDCSIVSGFRWKLTWQPTPFPLTFLSSNLTFCLTLQKVCILDMTHECFVWIAAQAMEEKRLALQYAHVRNHRPLLTLLQLWGTPINKSLKISRWIQTCSTWTKLYRDHLTPPSRLPPSAEHL